MSATTAGSAEEDYEVGIGGYSGLFVNKNPFTHSEIQPWEPACIVACSCPFQPPIEVEAGRLPD